MPKEINWEQFTQLTPEQREEMKTFVEHYGKTVEKYFGIELNEDYVRTQIEKNNEIYQNAQEFTRQTKHYDELVKQYPKPKECPNHEIFARGYRLYLTDNAEENRALQESLKTKEGQQAFINRMVSDLMEQDILQDSYLGKLDAAATAAKEKPAIQHLKFLSTNLKVAIDKEYPLEEPLKTAFEDKCKLIEFCDTNRAPTMLAATPMGLLLPMTMSEKDIGLTQQMIKKNGEAPRLVEYTNCINAAALEEEYANRIPIFHQMKEKGWLDNDVRLKNKKGNYINKAEALSGMMNGETFTAERLSPEASESLKEQMENLPIYRTGKEKEAAREYLNGQLENLKKTGIEFKADDLIAVSKNKETKLFFGKEDIYPRMLEYDRNTRQFKVGKPMKESPEEPKKPNGFKRFFNKLNANWFKKDFDKYAKEMRQYTAVKAAFDAVRPEIALRDSNAKDRQWEFREKQNELYDKQKDAERSFERPMENTGVIKENHEEKGMTAGKLDAVNSKVMEQRRSIDKMPDGTLKDFSKMVNDRLLNQMFAASPTEELTGRERDEFVTSMAYECVLHSLQKEHASLGDKAPGPLEQRLQKEMDTYGDDALPTVNAVKNNPTFKRLTETMTADRVTDFFLDNGAHKLNEAMAKADQAQRQKSGNDKQLQSDRQLDNKQPVLTNPDRQMHGPQNILGK